MTVVASGWMLFVLAAAPVQQQPQQPPRSEPRQERQSTAASADDVRAAVERFLSLPPAERDLGRTCRNLVYQVSLAEGLSAGERLDLFNRLRRAATGANSVTAAYAACAQVAPALELEDFAGVIRLCEQAATSPHRQVREEALRTLSQTLRDTGDVERAWPSLEQLRAVDPRSAALEECELLLRVGMVTAAGAAVDRLERDRGADDPAVACLRVEQLLVTERFADAFDLALRCHGDPRFTKSQPARLRLAHAFAAARLDRFDEAEQQLRALRADAATPASYRARVRADLAMLALRRGWPLDDVGAALGRDATAPLAELGEWSLAARARWELARAAAGRAGEIAALRDRLVAWHDFSQRQWNATPVDSAGVAFLQWSARRELLVCLLRAELALDDAGAADRCVQHLLAADACGSLARRNKWPRGTPSALRAAGVPPGGVLLWFVPAPNGSLALAVDAGDARATTLPSDTALRGHVRALREAVADEQRLGPDWPAALAALTAPLAEWIAPLRAELLRCARVTIVGRELLTGLPFEFLPSPTESTTWLGHTHAIDYLPSATLAIAAAEREAPTGNGAWLAVADELDATAVADWPGGAVEPGAFVGALAAIDSGDVHVVARAAAADVLRAHANAELLVVCAHGARRPAANGAAIGPAAGLVLRDGFFGAECLPASPDGLAPRVVVLAACGAARGGVERGEDGHLFGTAWLVAGSSCVLSAEGDLELASTEALVREVLLALSGHVDPAEALRLARRRVAEQPEWSHPALHCALRVDRAGPVPRLHTVRLGERSALEIPWAPVLIAAVLIGACARAVIRAAKRRTS